MSRSTLPASAGPVLTAAVVCLLPLAFSTRLEDAFAAPKMALLLVGTAFSLPFLAGVLRGALRRRAAPLPVSVLPILAWFSWVVVVTAARGVDWLVPGGVAHVAVCLLVFLILAAAPVGPRVRRTIAWLCVATAVIESALAVLQWRGIDPFFGRVTNSFAGAELTQRIIGTIGYQNALGEYLAMMVPLAVGVFLARRSAVGRVLGAASVLLILVAVALTRSRAAWLGTGVGLAAFWWGVRPAFHPRQKRWAGILLLLGVAAVGVMDRATRADGAMSIRSRLLGAFDAASLPWRQRELAWRVTAAMVMERPLAGHGYGAFQLRYLDSLGQFLSTPGREGFRRFVVNLKETHNDYLQMAAETGVIGLVLWMAGLGAILRQGGMRARRGAGDPETRLWFSALAGGCMAFAAVACFGFPLHVVPVAPLFWMLAGLAMNRPAGDVDAVRVHPAAVVGAVVPACALAFCLLQSSRLEAQGRSAAAVGRSAEAVETLSSALQLNPFNARLRFFLGSALLRDGRVDEGLEQLQTSTQGFSDVNLWRNIAQGETAVGRPAAAVGWLERVAATALSPDDAGKELALALLDAGRGPDAIAALRRLPEFKHEWERANTFLARHLVETGRAGDAIVILQRVAQDRGNEPEKMAEVLELLGIALAIERRPAEAEAALRRAVECAPRSLSALNNLAAVLRVAGKKEEAVRTWALVLEMDPGNEIARANLESGGVPSRMEGPAHE